MTKQTEALKMAIEWMEKYHQMHIIEMEVGERWIDLSMAIQACKEALDTEQVREDYAQPAQEVKCNPHPDAPHGFMRDESHSQDRYVCECEYWTQPAQEPVSDHEQYMTEARKAFGIAPSWQGLSDDEINAIANKTDKIFANSIFWVKAFAIAIEQALKEKNNAM